MILNRNFYTKNSFFKSWWNLRQARKFSGDKVFKAFKLHKTEWPNKLYFYSPRLKRIPRFTGNKELLASWQYASLCERMCPTQAIKATSDNFIIDSRGCIACGLCVEMAPEGLLTMTPEPKMNLTPEKEISNA